MTLGPRPYYWPNTKTVIFGYSPPVATRTGFMAIACLPFIIATSTKANVITLVTGVSHEKFQVFHRWISYACLVLALVHTFPFIVYLIDQGSMVKNWDTQIFYWTGTGALLFQAWLTFMSAGLLRDLSYEFFKIAHRFSGAIFVSFLFWHCNFELSSWDYFIASAAVYVPCFIYSQIKTYIENGSNLRASINVETVDIVKVKIPVQFSWHPGQHVFVRFRAFGHHAFTSHPFTVCSLPSSKKQSEVILYIRPQKGLTARLHDYTNNNSDERIAVFLSGPYGGVAAQDLLRCQRLLLVAGGSGAGWILPLVECFLSHVSHGNGASSNHNTLDEKATSLRIILAAREHQTRSWFLEAINGLVARYPDIQVSNLINIQVHLTPGFAADPGEQQEMGIVGTRIVNSSASPESDIQRLEDSSGINHSTNSHCYSIGAEYLMGRPDLAAIVHGEAMRLSESWKTLGVSVCGPSSMQHDVRNAAAQENADIVRQSKAGSVYVHLEHFSWA